MNTNAFRRVALVSIFMVAAGAASAQGFPGGGGGMGRMHGGSRMEPREGADKPRDPLLQSHPLAALAAALEREAPGLNLAPQAAAAMSDFVRELRDFAALDDRHVRERIGWARSTVHANVDLQRDLVDIEESAHEVDAAANDVIARWQKLRELLDDVQRDRVQGIYSAALIDARQPRGRDVNPRRNPE